MDAQDIYLRDFYFSNPLLQIRIRLHFGSTPFKDIFRQKQDILLYLLKIIQKFWLVKSGEWNRHIRSVVAQIWSYDIIIA